MTARVDFAISPPGIIRGAMCHTLVIDEEGLCIIKVSRGWRVGFNPAGALQGAVANATIGHLYKKAKAATEAVTPDNYRQAAQGKGSVVVPRGELSDVQWSPDRLDLRLRGRGKKYRFQFESSQAESAQAFASALQAGG